MATLKKEIEALLIQFGDNGHSGDPFYCGVREAVVRPPKEKKPARIYLDFSERMWKGITQEDIGEWMDCYSMTDTELMFQLKKAKGWCMSHGARGRKRDWPKFIGGWLSRAQDRGRMAR